MGADTCSLEQVVRLFITSNKKNLICYNINDCSIEYTVENAYTEPSSRRHTQTVGRWHCSPHDTATGSVEPRVQAAFHPSYLHIASMLLLISTAHNNQLNHDP